MKKIFPILITLLGISFAQTTPSSHYEAFLDSTENYLNSVLPEKEKLESQKSVVSAEIASPKDEFESTAAYEQRLAEFEKTKQQKILALEQDYQNRTKATMDKLKATITSKEDIQPNWEGILQKSGNIEKYRERINKLTDKISTGTIRIDKLSGLFAKLELDNADGETLAAHWLAKKQAYISRLEKARELMRDYIIQEQSKILTTEKQKFDMSLGAYNADKEEFEFSVNDAQSQTVPFDFSGVIKMQAHQARETNRQTDNFAASVSYVNYPFIVDGNNLYPGVKKINVFYKEQELVSAGSFKAIPGLNQHSGFIEWVTYTDSLLTGKLAPRNLDSLYAMGKSAAAIATATAKNESGSPFWTKKTAFRIAMFGLSAASVGLGVWQNSEVSSKDKKMKNKYFQALNSPSAETYAAFQKSVDDVKTSENLRTGFYIGAGVFGAAGIASFFF